MPTKELKVEFETHPVIVDAKIGKYSTKFKVIQTFCAFYSLSYFSLFLQ